MEASRSLLCGARRVEPRPKGRGAEQGDVDGPLECSLALGGVAAEARLHVAGHQAAGIALGLAQAVMNQCKDSKMSSMFLLQN